MEKRSDKSVLKPSAQYTKLCGGGLVSEAALAAFRTLSLGLISKQNPLGVLMELQLFSGCRVSSLLSINWSHINNMGFCLVHESKGSQNRYVSSPNSAQYLISCKKRMINPFEGMSRFYVYREYKKLGLSMSFNDNINNSVTHLLRHVYISELNSVSDNIEDTARLVGHKNVNSTKHYVGKH